MSSINPDSNCDELNCGEEIPRGLVGAGGDLMEFLESGEEVLNAVPRFVDIAV